MGRRAPAVCPLGCSVVGHDQSCGDRAGIHFHRDLQMLSLEGVQAAETHLKGI